MTIDLRSLAAARIALAIALLLSLCNRALQLQNFYSNDGLLPNHAVLWSPVYPYELSFFLCLSHTHEAVVGVAICFAAFTALLLGYKTGVAQVASFFCAMSLRNRVPLLLNGGDLVLGLLAFWTMFLPLGARYSVDTARLRVRDTHQETTSEVVSLATLALLLQLSVIYALNFVQKNGETWVTGSALHYTLHQDRIVTSFGVWLREHLSASQSVALTRSTLIIEALVPLCVLSPLAASYSRRLAALLIFVLHVGFGLCLNLGVFAPAMIAFSVVLIPGKDWERLAKATRRLHVADVFTWIAQRIRLDARAVMATRRSFFRSVVVVLAMLLASYQLLRENPFFSALRPAESKTLDAAVIYLGLFQGWSMFAPDAPTTDLNVSIDAVTIEGKHVDPLNAIASANHTPGLRIPAHLDQPWLFAAYIAHVPSHPQFNTMFIDWIGHHHVRTGRATDRIAKFDAYIVEDDSPPLGKNVPSNTRWRRIISHSF